MSDNSWVPLKTALERTYRAAGATVISTVLLPLIPGVLETLPPPWNLILTMPTLMALSKWAREKFRDATWVKFLPS